MRRLADSTRAFVTAVLVGCVGPSDECAPVALGPASAEPTSTEDAVECEGTAASSDIDSCGELVGAACLVSTDLSAACEHFGLGAACPTVEGTRAGPACHDSYSGLEQCSNGMFSADHSYTEWYWTEWYDAAGDLVAFSEGGEYAWYACTPGSGANVRWWGRVVRDPCESPAAVPCCPGGQ